jgi:hypothetical protein
MKELYCSLEKKGKSEALVDGCHNTILKLLSNIINNPEETRFKYLFATNKSIQMNILQYQEGQELIKLAGFTKTQENEQ